MIELDIPGERRLALSHLALDFNGTLAFDGKLIHEVKPRLIELAGLLTIHVITGNTFGTATDELQGIPCSIIELRPEYQAQAKWEAIHRIGANMTVAIGNGRNDAQRSACHCRIRSGGGCPRNGGGGRHRHQGHSGGAGAAGASATADRHSAHVKCHLFRKCFSVQAAQKEGAREKTGPQRRIAVPAPSDRTTPAPILNPT